MIEIIWARIKRFEGETFYQIRGGQFTYMVRDSHLIPSRTNQNIPKKHFKEALTQVPLFNTASVRRSRPGT
jgi:hypothetical protein